MGECEGEDALVPHTPHTVRVMFKERLRVRVWARVRLLSCLVLLKKFPVSMKDTRVHATKCKANRVNVQLMEVRRSLAEAPHTAAEDHALVACVVYVHAVQNVSACPQLPLQSP